MGIGISTMQAKINELEKKFEELDCNNSDLEQVLKNVKQDIECAKESTQLKGDLKAITEKSSQLQSKLESIEQDLTKITQCAEEHTQLQSKLESIEQDLTKITQCAEEHTQLQSELESMVTTELKKHESTLENRVENLQEQFEGKNKELNSKYEKFLRASNNSKRQGSYASISFVLSGASAVGASLTMFHLAICLSLAVAALIFLATGCYCLYKANTTLSNIEIDQTQTTNFLTA
uniref:Uncharacterized protein n=1 Tax=Wolbachia endosymbiont of Oeneis ivallda TaxID=3171168 RepID=A0AAU7YLZ3_9RICK